MEDLLQPYTPEVAGAPPKNNYPELQLHKEICRHIKLTRPQTIFQSDLNAGRYEKSNFYKNLKVALNSSDSFPDLMIYAKRTVTLKGEEHEYCGMALELKAPGTTIIVTRGERKGHLTSDPHIRKQYLMLKELEKEGWYVNFICNFDEFMQVWCWFFGLPKPDPSTLF